MNKSQDIDNNSVNSNWKLKFRKYIVPVSLLIILTIIVSWITYQRVLIQINIGPDWDTFAFLANAMEFAGKGFGYTEPHRPPFLSFITSLFFSLGYVDESTIFFVDGVFFVLGAIGLYLLFKLRFDTIQSVLGSLFFVSFPIVLKWVATGYTDVASVSLSIWVLYFTVLAVTKNSKFFLIAFPLLSLTFLTRYPSVLIIFPMVLYIFIKGNFLSKFKDIFLGIIFSIIVFSPILLWNNKIFGDPFYPYVGALSVTEGTSATESFAYNSNPFYYLTKLDSFIIYEDLKPWIIYLVVILIVIGLLLYLREIISMKVRKIKIRTKLNNLLKIERKFSKIKILLLIFLTIIFLITFNRVSFLSSEIIFFALLVLLYNVLDGKNIKGFDIDLLFFSWFLTFFIFHSSFNVKVDRYFITMAPSFSYLLVLAINQISNKINYKIKDINLSSWLLSLFFIFLILFSSLSYINTMPQDKDYLVEDTILASNWLKNNDKDYQEKQIYSDLWPAVSWYLKTNVEPMPTFKDKRAFNHELEKYNIDYYFTIRSGRNLTSYKKISQFGTMIIYQLDPKIVGNKSSALYIGKNWQNYLEDVLDFNIFVIYEGGKYKIGKSIYIDNYSIEELKKYKYLFLYNFKWHDRLKAEKLIREYANSGGTVIFDASGNLDGIYYNMDDSIFLDTLIKRKSLDEYPNVWISPKIGYPAKLEPFISDGGIWYGATYISYGDNKIENLVTVNGDTLIGVQKMGKGKIIWIGYNLIWHAFYSESNEEKILIQKVLEL
ncbi:MAG: glycosyltransferase family 39 protein [Methanomicrobiales archaeon]